MPISNSIAKLVVKPVPKIISPKAHEAFDYVTLGSFLMGAVWFWPRNRRATIAALICGGAEFALCLLTDYKGDLKNEISLQAHREIDLGLAALTATMPKLFSLSDDEKKFFLAQGAIITVNRELTKSQRVSLSTESLNESCRKSFAEWLTRRLTG